MSRTPLVMIEALRVLDAAGVRATVVDSTPDEVTVRLHLADLDALARLVSAGVGLDDVADEAAAIGEDVASMVRRLRGAS